MSTRGADEDMGNPTAQRVAEFLASATASSRSVEGADTFTHRVQRFRHVRRTRRWVTGGVAVCAVVALVAFEVVSSRVRVPGPLLSYRVDGLGPAPGGYVSVPDSIQAVVAFSDGSKVKMHPRSRGRVVEVNDRGARFALEGGRVIADIVPHERARWLFEAGPFVVVVHGTSFDLGWNPVETLFEVRLINGAVSVTSPTVGPDVHLRAGEVLRVSLRDHTRTISAVTPGAAFASPEASPAAPVPVPALAPPGSAAAQAVSVWPSRRWEMLVAEGKGVAVLAEADASGIGRALSEADSDDLWALATAARYAGRFSLARQALLAHRKRFRQSERAHDAAFLMGGLHDRDAQGPTEALGWYDRYLTEAPDGVHVSDALGRKMTLLERWNRRTEALVVAQDYLRRFPRGTYASAARALLRVGAGADR